MLDFCREIKIPQSYLCAGVDENIANYFCFVPAKPRRVALLEQTQVMTIGIEHGSENYFLKIGIENFTNTLS